MGRLISQARTEQAKKEDISFQSLLGHKLENNTDFAGRQDINILNRIATASAIDLPKNIKPGEFVVAPLDIMPHEIPGGKKGAMLLELNGTGYGNITTLHPETLKSINNSFAMIADSLKDVPNALVLVPCSGREDPPNFAASKKIHEKIMIGSSISERFKALGHEKVTEIGIDSFQKKSSNTLKNLRQGLKTDVKAGLEAVRHFDQDGIRAMRKKLRKAGWNAKDAGPTVVVGYTAQLAKAIKIGENGEPMMFGRRVHAIVNDRASLNVDALHARKGKKLDPNTFIACNRSYVPAADKGTAYAYMNEFNSTAAAKMTPEYAREIVNKQANSLAEIEEKVLEMLKEGRHAIIKPSGTGHGDGIVPIFAHEWEGHPDFKPADAGGYPAISEQIKKSYDSVKATYGDRGGFPYTVGEYVIADRIKSDNPAFDTMKYEYRVAVYADYSNPEKPQLKAAPAIIKIDAGSQLQEGQDGKFSKQLASVSTQVLQTGRPASDFMKPLANAETMEMIDFPEEEMTKLCQWATKAVGYILENVDAKTEVGGDKPGGANDKGKAPVKNDGASTSRA